MYQKFNKTIHEYMILVLCHYAQSIFLSTNKFSRMGMKLTILHTTKIGILEGHLICVIKVDNYLILSKYVEKKNNMGLFNWAIQYLNKGLICYLLLTDPV